MSQVQETNKKDVENVDIKEIDDDGTEEKPLTKDVQDLLYMAMIDMKAIRYVGMLINLSSVFIFNSILLSPIFGAIHVILMFVPNWYFSTQFQGRTIETSDPGTRELLHHAKFLAAGFKKQFRLVKKPIPVVVPRNIFSTSYLYRALIKDNFLLTSLVLLFQVLIFGYRPFGFATIVITFGYLIIGNESPIHKSFLPLPHFVCRMMLIIVPAKVLWIKKIKDYFKLIHDQLSTLDLSDEDAKKKALLKIQSEYEKNQRFAMEMNKTLSTWNFMVIKDVVCLLLDLLTVSLLLAKSEIHIWQKVMVLIFLFRRMYFYVKGIQFNLVGVAKANMVWVNEERHTIHDPNMQLKLEQVLGVGFRDWLSQHELASQRILRLRITIPVRVQITSAIFTGFASIAMYIIAQQVNPVVVFERLKENIL